MIGERQRTCGNDYPSYCWLLLQLFRRQQKNRSVQAACPAWSQRVPVAKDAKQFFVAPDGQPANNGAKESPWDLASTLAGKHTIPPGSIVWVRGGTYGRGKDTVFNCRLKGTEASPIFLRQYPGERATVDGGIEAGQECDWVWFWGFEITNSSTERRCLTSERPPGLNLAGRGSRPLISPSTTPAIPA